MIYGYVAVSILNNGKVYVHQHKSKTGLSKSYHGSGKVFVPKLNEVGLKDKILLTTGNKKLVDYAERFWIEVFGGAGYDFSENYNIAKGGDGGRSPHPFVIKDPEGRVHAGVGRYKFFRKFQWQGSRTISHPQSDWEELPLDYSGKVDEYHS